MKNQEDYYLNSVAAASTNVGKLSGTINVTDSGVCATNIPSYGGNTLTAGGTYTITPSGTWTIPSTTIGSGVYGYGDVVTSPWAGSGSVFGGGFYEAKPSWLEKAIDKRYIKKLIDEKNYSLLCSIADIAAKISRPSFKLLEQSIVRSGDFEIIGLYLKSVKNVDVKHLTRNFLRTYMNSNQEGKVDRFSNLAYEARQRIDLKYCFRFALKQKDPIYIQWLINPYNSSFDTEIAEAKVPTANVNALVSMCTDTNLLFTLAHVSTMVNKEKIYRKIRNLGNYELARKLVDNSDEAWAKKLVHMK